MSARVIFFMSLLIFLLAVSCEAPQVTEKERAPAHGEGVGVWKLVEITVTGPQAQTISVTEPGYMIVTDKYASFTGAMAPRQELPEEPTDAQLAAAYKAFTADIVKYEIKENSLTAETLIDLNPNTKQGYISTMDFNIEGNDLTITPKEEQGVPVENPYTLKFTRID